MRSLVLVLAILLLPLRGWLGDGMGTAMAIEAAQAPAAVHAMSADAHSMHGMHEMHEAEGTSHEAHTTAPDCHSSCSDCQLCHSVAMAVPPALTAAVEAPRTAPAFAPGAFASAEPAPGFKPPIS